MAPDFRLADHLPKLREGGRPADPNQLPRQRRGRTPQMHGRYPDYDVLEQAAHWDELDAQVGARPGSERAADPVLHTQGGGHP